MGKHDSQITAEPRQVAQPETIASLMLALGQAARAAARALALAAPQTKTAALHAAAAAIRARRAEILSANAIDIAEAQARGTAGSFIDRLLLSQDLCINRHFTVYGAKGYAFLITEFVALMQEAGLAQEQIDTLLIENPRRMLTGE